MDLSSSYLGLSLKNPFIVGAGPLANDLGTARRLEDEGAAAIVVHSLFEEQLLAVAEGDARSVERPQESFAEALTYLPKSGELLFRLGAEEYLEHLRRLKAALSIPVIGSLNGVTAGGWVEWGRRIAQTGADALELNVYYLPTDARDSGRDVEDRVVGVARAVKEAVGLPLAVKLSPFFSSLPHLVGELERAGADGVVLFNRFYQPDIDVEELEAVSSLHLSDSSELLLRLRWLAILSGRGALSLGVTGGVHTASDAIKAVMAGAHGVQMVSALLRNGAGHLRKVREETEAWLESHDYVSVDQMRGSMSLRHCPDPSALERANYLKVLHSRRA